MQKIKDMGVKNGFNVVNELIAGEAVRAVRSNTSRGVCRSYDGKESDEGQETHFDDKAAQFRLTEFFWGIVGKMIEGLCRTKSVYRNCEHSPEKNRKNIQQLEKIERCPESIS